MKIVLSGGGTGGHITPIRALADALHNFDPKLQLEYIGLGREQEAEVMRGSKLRQYKIVAGKLRRYYNETPVQKIFDIKTNILNLVDGIKVIVGLIQSVVLLRKLHPDVVFVKGGFVGLPVGLAARFWRIPLVIHESDARPGLTNRVLARYARVIATGFPSVRYKQWQGKAVVYTGNPVRQSIMDASRGEARKQLRLRPTDKAVLIIGGSSGAQEINNAIEANIAELINRYVVFHVCGKSDYNHFVELQHKLGGSSGYHPFGFVGSKYPVLLQAADVVVSRAGMNSVAEVAIAAKPLVLVPAPQLSDQTVNAKVLVHANAAAVITQQDLPHQLVDVLEHLFSSKNNSELLASNLRALAKPRAAADLANIIIQSAKL